jgi:hypothetical protein
VGRRSEGKEPAKIDCKSIFQPRVHLRYATRGASQAAQDGSIVLVFAKSSNKGKDKKQPRVLRLLLAKVRPNFAQDDSFVLVRAESNRCVGLNSELGELDDVADDRYA